MKSSRLTSAYLAAFSKNWGLFLLWGIVLVILGIAAIYGTTMATVLSVLFLGILIFFGGVVIIIDTFTFWWNKWSGFFIHLLLGILYLAIGIMMVRSPMLASVSITLFLGLFYLFVGILRIIYSLSVRVPRWGWSFFNGVVSLILGILILINWPQSGLYIIGLFVGIDLLFTGWTYIIAALVTPSLTGKNR